jgi:hypothetical protein
MEHRQAGLLGVAVMVVACSWTGCADQDTYIRASVRAQPVSNFPGPLANLERVDGYLDIQGFHRIGPQTEELLSLHIPNTHQGARLRLRSSGRGAWASYFVRETTTDDIESYHTDENHGGTAIVTQIDSARGIVEGTFEFDGVLARRRGPRQNSDTLRVRGGSFRVRYHIIPADAYDRPSRD